MTKSAQSKAQQASLSGAGLLDVAATILIAATAVLTAWAAFQIAQWHGIQADYSRLGAAAGIASSRETTIASAQRTVDVGTFLQWLQAVQSDIDAGHLDPAEGAYVAEPRTLSGFISIRFRPEFRTAFDAWVGMRPLLNSSAAATPFELPEYVLAADLRAKALADEANENAVLAHQATQTAEDYVLATVLFALALVFTSIATRLSNLRTAGLVVGIAFLIIVGAGIGMAALPVEV